MGAQGVGEVEDRGHDGVRAPVAARVTAGLVQQLAVRADQGGLHSRAAHIERDHMSHPDSLTGGA